jgi:hypothetical protein
MYRLIYFDSRFGYQTVDFKDDSETAKAEDVVKKSDALLICVVDYCRKAILKKCDDFSSHQEQIDHIIFDPKMTGMYY